MDMPDRYRIYAADGHVLKYCDMPKRWPVHIDTGDEWCPYVVFYKGPVPGEHVFGRADVQRAGKFTIRQNMTLAED